MIVTAMDEILSTWYLYNYKAFFVGVLMITACIIGYSLYRLFACLFRRKIKYVNPIQLVWRGILISLFGVYGYFLIAITILSRQAGTRTGFSLELFHAITGSSYMRIQALENFLLFIPFGIFVALIFWSYWGKCGRFWFSFLWGFSISVLIEMVQLAFGYGYFELDDIVLNTLGSFLGYLLIFFVWCIWWFYWHFCQKIRFLMQLLMIIGMLYVIFGFSSDMGEESAVISELITQQIVKVLDVFVPGTWSGTVQAAWVDLLHPIIRKLAHMTEYALLAATTLYFLYQRHLRGKRLFLPAWIFCMIVSVADEIYQSFIPGRAGVVYDVGYDFLGTTLMIVFIYGYYWISKKRVAKK